MSLKEAADFANYLALSFKTPKDRSHQPVR